MQIHFLVSFCFGIYLPLILHSFPSFSCLLYFFTFDVTFMVVRHNISFVQVLQYTTNAMIFVDSLPLNAIQIFPGNVRSVSALDTAAVQRARARQQYSTMARLKVTSGTASLRKFIAYVFLI